MRIFAKAIRGKGGTDSHIPNTLSEQDSASIGTCIYPHIASVYIGVLDCIERKADEEMDHCIILASGSLVVVTTGRARYERPV